MMDALQNYLYLISNALLAPTLFVLLALSAWTALMLGGLMREWLSRRTVRRHLLQARKSIMTAGHPDAGGMFVTLSACPSGLPQRFIRMLDGSWRDALEREKCLEDLESEVAVSLSKLTWVTRVAPMLGLMGTLIPLGPALTALASGNIAMLSSNLVVAFTATVIGVLIGCSAFTMNLIRRNWYQQDMSDLEYITTRLSGALPRS